LKAMDPTPPLWIQTE
nr:anti-bothropic complex 48,000 subuint {N-terminal} [Lutreolina crassicaudata, Peptide Partial, 15 aa] [Lutreolina crassicaudata]